MVELPPELLEAVPLVARFDDTSKSPLKSIPPVLSKNVFVPLVTIESVPFTRVPPALIVKVIVPEPLFSKDKLLKELLPE